MYQVEQTNRQTINHVILSIPNPQQKRDENETKYLQTSSTLTVNFLMTKSDVDTNVANKQTKTAKSKK